MKIKRGEIVTLSDDISYIVLSKVLYEGKNYLYLTSMEENPKIKICCEKEDSDQIKLSVVTDMELVSKLILLFDENVKEIL